MCQLLGMNANTPTDVMFSFTGFAQRADEHKDGFGIAFFEGPGVRLMVDAQSARTSPIAEMVRRFPIRSCHIVAHIRKATRGAVALQNTHPFVRELCPDPTKDVWWGDQTWEEMMFTGLTFSIDPPKSSATAGQQK